MTAGGAEVRLEGVSAGYGRLRRRVVLDGMELSAAAGQVTAVVGPNGVGKTTLFRLLLGFLTPWSGSVRIDGASPREVRRREGVAYLPESVALPPGYTLAAFLEEGALLSGLRGAGARAAVEAALDRSALGDAAGRPLGTLSKGMARRAAFAWILTGDPRLLLLDEPLSGLDPASRAALRTAVADAARRGTTVVLASHETEEVRKVADAVLVLDRGRVVRRLDRAALVLADLEELILEAERLP